MDVHAINQYPYISTEYPPDSIERYFESRLHRLFPSQYEVVGLRNRARDRVRLRLLDFLFSDSFGLAADDTIVVITFCK